VRMRTADRAASDIHMRKDVELYAGSAEIVVGGDHVRQNCHHDRLFESAVVWVISPPTLSDGPSLD
jgi:hypothetical protein